MQASTSTAQTVANRRSATFTKIEDNIARISSGQGTDEPSALIDMAALTMRLIYSTSRLARTTEEHLQLGEYIKTLMVFLSFHTLYPE